MLHLLMCSSFIGRVANTGLHLVASTVCKLVFSSITGRQAQAGLCSVLQDGWPRLACVQ